jgi:acyl-coenzyme A synthetase/AMP-(fatty) acid ligase
MLQSDAPPLRRWLDGVAGPPRHFWGARKSVAFTDLVAGSSLGRRLGALQGRSVLLATRDQLTAALAMIELDGIAGRLVICPPDVPHDHFRAIVATAEVDAIVTDCGSPDTGAPDPRTLDPRTLGIPLHVECSARIEPRHDPQDQQLLGSRQTEWVLLTSGTTGVPKLVSHNVASLTAPIKAAAGAPVWGTFYDIRRYGGLQIFLRAVVGGGSLILSSAGESVADHLARLAAHGVTHISGTPSHWWRVLMGSAARTIAPRYVRLSGEIADQTMLDNLRAVYPQAGLGHAYASTEAGVGFEVDDGLEGFPAHFVDAGNRDVDIKVVGSSLRLRSARTAARYIGTDVPALVDGDGFVDTGDIVERRGERYYFVGRKDGIINVGGLKVHPEEVEAAINRHAGIWGSLVKSRKSPITGAIVIADVVLKASPDGADAGPRLVALEREIVDACRRDLAPYKVPAVIRFVSALPMSATGKLVRHA